MHRQLLLLHRTLGVCGCYNIAYAAGRPGSLMAWASFTPIQRSIVCSSSHMCWHLQEDAHDFLRQWLDKAHDCHEKLLRQHCPSPQARLVLPTPLASSALLPACPIMVLLEHHLTVSGTYMPEIMHLALHPCSTPCSTPLLYTLALHPCSIYPPWLIMHVTLQMGGAFHDFV